MRWTEVPAEERFWAKVTPREDGCWIWTGSIRSNGYGSFGADYRTLLAHRFAYQSLIGPVPDGLTLDHLCRVRACVNPTHLEPVTDTVNILRGESPMARNARKTHCKRGHELTPDNVHWYEGHRLCRACFPINNRLQKQRRLERELAS